MGNTWFRKTRKKLDLELLQNMFVIYTVGDYWVGKLSYGSTRDRVKINSIKSESVLQCFNISDASVDVTSGPLKRELIKTSGAIHSLDFQIFRWEIYLLLHSDTILNLFAANISVFLQFSCRVWGSLSMLSQIMVKTDRNGEQSIGKFSPFCVLPCRV